MVWRGSPDSFLRRHAHPGHLSGSVPRQSGGPKAHMMISHDTNPAAHIYRMASTYFPLALDRPGFGSGLAFNRSRASGPILSVAGRGTGVAELGARYSSAAVAGARTASFPSLLFIRGRPGLRLSLSHAGEPHFAHLFGLGFCGNQSCPQTLHKHPSIVTVPIPILIMQYF